MKSFINAIKVWIANYREHERLMIGNSGNFDEDSSNTE